MPFPLAFPFSIRRFNFFCLQVLLTRASLLALAKSILFKDSGGKAVTDSQGDISGISLAK